MMIRQSSIRYVLCSDGRRHGARCCLLLLLTGCVLLVLPAFLLLGTFYGGVTWFWGTTGHQNDGEEIVVIEEHPPQPILQKYRRPEPLQCPSRNSDSTMGQTSPSSSSASPPLSYIKHPKYCAWHKNLQDCYTMLLRNEPMIQASSWVFLGAQDMSVLTDFVARTWPYKDQVAKTITRRNHCQNLLYYGLQPPSDGWKVPNSSLGEGPTAYGLEHSYCSDCRNCWNVLVDATPPPPALDDNSAVIATQQQQQRYIEYLVVEYARDVTIQTTGSNTTQDTVSYHLRWKRPQVCVVSVGLFDASIEPRVSETVFLKNMDRYLLLLHRACKTVVWISIPAVVEDDSLPHFDNCGLKSRNVAIMNMLVERNYTNLYILDIWDKSLETDHSSFLQLSHRFYASLSRLFVAMMMGHNKSEHSNHEL